MSLHELLKGAGYDESIIHLADSVGMGIDTLFAVTPQLAINVAMSAIATFAMMGYGKDVGDVLCFVLGESPIPGVLTQKKHDEEVSALRQRLETMQTALDALKKGV